MVVKVYSKMEQVNKYKYDPATLQEIRKLLGDLEDSVESITVYSECKVYDTGQPNNHVTYRASPYMSGHPWEDWGMFDCSYPDQPDFRDFVPCQMKAFLLT